MADAGCWQQRRYMDTYSLINGPDPFDVPFLKLQVYVMIVWVKE
jgi:hypothetical protein